MIIEPEKIEMHKTEKETLEQLHQQVLDLSKIRDMDGIEKPLLFNRCPYCKSKLTTKKFWLSDFTDSIESVVYIHKKCTNCNYKWGSINGW